MAIMTMTVQTQTKSTATATMMKKNKKIMMMIHISTGASNRNRNRSMNSQRLFTSIGLTMLLLQGLLMLLFSAVPVKVVQAVRRDPSFMVNKLKEEIEGRKLKNSSQQTIGVNVNVPKAKNPNDHLVTNMPLLENVDFKNTKHWSGLLPVNDKGDGYLFYWLFEPDPDAVKKAKHIDGLIQDETKDIPLVIWLNGGPACSSMDGLWIENGPFRLKPASGSGGWDNIEIDPFSWHTAPAYTLYIDQPVGTGLSFTTSGNYPSDDEKVNVDFYYFLTEFMKLHSDKFTTTEGKTTTLRRPFYFTGESHAGHYIPSMMNYIRKKNIEIKNQPKPNQDSVIMPLTGALIGNGWFDPIYQYSAHEAAYGYGLIGKGQERALAKKEETCRSDLIAGTYTSRKCFSLLDDVIHNSLGGSDAPYTVSQYDQRKWELKSGSSREFPPGHKDVEAYLGQAEKISNAPIQDVLKSIHAMPSWEAGQRYRECTDPPYNALAHQDGLGVTQDIVELLNHMDDGSIESEANIDPGAININKIQLLFFNGIHDLICNHVGNENALENLEWTFQNEFQTAERYGWKSASIDKLGGYMKEYENLYFLKVLNSGHMVPMDVPGVALDMLQTFIYKQSFQTYKQNLNAENGSDSGSSSSCSKCPAQGKCDDDGVSIECPVCGDNANAVNSNTKNNFNSCSRTICENKYDFTSTSNNASTIQNISSSPIVPGVVGGAAVFVTIAGMACFVWAIRSCFCRRKGGIGKKQFGAVELSTSMQQNGGFSDHSDGEKGFSDEDIADIAIDDWIRRRGTQIHDNANK